MDAKEIHQHWKREPFVPFRLELDDGTRHHVLTPGDMFLAGGRIYAGDHRTALEGHGWSTFVPEHVANLELLPDVELPAGDEGKRKRPRGNGDEIESQAMTARELTKKIDKQPFIPMRVTLTDGMSYDLTHNSRLMMLNGELVIGLDADNDGVPSRSVYVDPHHITRVETLAAKQSNGQQNTP